MGTARGQFIEAARAATNLLAQFSEKDDQGYPRANQQYDQMQMLVRCLPILLLRISSMAQRQKFTQVVNRRCAQFLKGEWKLLYDEVLGDYEVQNEWDRTHLRRPDSNNKQRIVLDQARKLNYSKAMNILHSPGLAADSPAAIAQQLQDWHQADVAART